MKKEKERERQEKKKKEAEKLAAVKVILHFSTLANNSFQKKREEEQAKKREMQMKKTPAKASKPVKKLGLLRSKMEEIQKKNTPQKKAPAFAPPETPISQPQSMPIRMQSVESDDEVEVKKVHHPEVSITLKVRKSSKLFSAELHNSIEINASAEQSEL